jgi:hypothetical protein
MFVDGATPEQAGFAVLDLSRKEPTLSVRRGLSLGTLKKLCDIGNAIKPCRTKKARAARRIGDE